jgi:hypothetical protein
MRAITVVVFLGLAALAAATVTPIFGTKEADKDFLLKQKTILEVLHHVYQYEETSKYYKDAQSYDIEKNLNKYTNVEAVKEFLKWYEYDVLNREDVFSIMYEKHRDYAVSLFHVFYYCKDWETFYNTMVWAKYNVNPGVFVYSLTVAVLHRPELKGIVLPAPYEIYPYYFFNTELIQKAQWYKMQDFQATYDGSDKDCHEIKKVDNKWDLVLPYNYTMDFIDMNWAQRISYFTEDIGLNTYYYYFHMDYPFWMEGKEFGLNKDRRGELYLFKHQQLLARYYLERLSLGLGEIQELSFFEPIKTGYNPMLRYYSGLMFTTRPNYYNLYHEKNYYDIHEVINYERRIRDAIDYGFVILPDGTKIDLTKPESINIIGNMIQGNPDFPLNNYFRYLAIYARIILGSTVEYQGYEKTMPSVLEHFETSMRDPVFYQLYKRIVRYYWQFYDNLPHYTEDELNFKGVEIEKVEVDKLVTYFDTFDADISNAVEFNYHDEKVDYFGDYVIKARTHRLNHLPFIVKLGVKSDKAAKSVIRIFLGPKYDEFGNILDVNENRENFWLWDKFVFDLKSGSNEIVRDSKIFTWFVDDRTTYYQLYKEVMTAFNGGEKFMLDNTEMHCGFPYRLMLPRGRTEGMPFQLFFMVTPFVAPTVEQYSTFEQIYTCGVGSGSRYVDSLPIGYPFDREIDETYWFTPNMWYEDVMVYHKREKEINNPFTY